MIQQRIRVIALAALTILLHSCFTNSSFTEGDGSDDSSSSNNSSSNNNSADVDEANTLIDEHMLEYYLYNEEYSTITRDLTLDYDEMFYDALMSMSGNVLDKKPANDDSTLYTIYSWVDRTESAKSRSVNQTDISFGFVSLEYVVATIDGVQDLVLAVNAVYNDTPASDASISRSDIITHINGSSIYTLYAIGSSLPTSLLYPSNGQEATLTLYGWEEDVTLTAESTSLCPILYALEISEGIGYLNLVSFNYYFNNDLLTAMSILNSADISELIVDLRLNTGGHVYSSNLLSTAVLNGGTNEVFCYYRFNEDLTENRVQTSSELGVAYSENAGMFFDYFLSNVADSCRLDVERVYCLVSGYTASASELFINALRGSGVEVILIGECTAGKNVGSYTTTFYSGEYTYEISPIMFELFNGSGEGDYSAGFEVDEEVDDYSYFCDFGYNDPMIAKALELAGVTTTTTQQRQTRSTSESVETTGKRLQDPRQIKGALLM